MSALLPAAPVACPFVGQLSFAPQALYNALLSRPQECPDGLGRGLRAPQLPFSTGLLLAGPTYIPAAPNPLSVPIRQNRRPLPLIRSCPITNTAPFGISKTLGRP